MAVSLRPQAFRLIRISLVPKMAVKKLKGITLTVTTTVTAKSGCNPWSNAIKHLMVAIIGLLIPVTAMAEGECQQDRQTFCKDETKANVGACLDQHTAELSEACKAMREARALASPASAETSPKPPSAQGSGTAPSAEAKPSSEVKPSSEAEQPNADAPAGKPEPKPEATQNDSEAAPTEPGPQILINIDKSLQQMTVFVDGVEKYSWPVSTGRYGYSTPSGTFTPTSMNEVWYSKQWDNSPMPHSIFFMKDGHAIHGSHEVKTLGKPVSHGCVRISPENAAILYDLVKTNGMQNTKVVLAGVTPGDESNVPEEQAYGGPWFAPGPGYYPPPPRRRGLFGGWFRWGPYAGPQGYDRPPRGYYPGY
jgi:lipoprotein-anchoring transpeptidase ErfK/SrfK